MVFSNFQGEGMPAVTEFLDVPVSVTAVVILDY